MRFGSGSRLSCRDIRFNRYVRRPPDQGDPPPPLWPWPPLAALPVWLAPVAPAVLVRVCVMLFSRRISGRSAVHNAIGEQDVHADIYDDIALAPAAGTLESALAASMARQRDARKDVAAAEPAGVMLPRPFRSSS